jgi:hypothetical protein
MQNGAILNGEKSLVAGAFEAVILRGIKDGTREVRAFLAVGHAFVLAGAHHDAVILR